MSISFLSVMALPQRYVIWADYKVYDVFLGRSSRALQPSLSGLSDRHRVQLICMDLSETYRNIAREYFPNAKIVADRFHVIRLINHHFLKVWQSIDPTGKRSRGLLSLLRRHPNKLSETQVGHLNDYFTKFPALRTIWHFKYRLCALLSIKHRTKKQCKRLITIFLKDIQMLKESPFSSMQVLGSTLESWREEIACMWRFTKSNGITEGFHNKMEVISRRAYGFRNFQNYRLRVRALCA